MKIILIALILYFSVNLISSIQWYYFPLNQETKSTSKLSHRNESSLHLGRSAFQRRNQRHPSNIPPHEVIIVSSKNYTSPLFRKYLSSRQKYSFNNNSLVHYKVNNTSKRRNRIRYQQSFPSNTSRLLQQQHFLDTFLIFQHSNKSNNQTKKRIIHPKFSGIPFNSRQIHYHTVSRVPSLKSIALSSKHSNSSIIKNRIQALHLASISRQKMMNTTKLNSHPNLIKQSIDNHNYRYRQHLLASLYKHQIINSSDQIRNYFVWKQRQLQHDKNNASSKLFISSNFSHPRSIH